MSRCREEFEAWFNNGSKQGLERDINGNYKFIVASAAWNAWDAGYAAGYNMRSDEVKAAMA